MRKTSSAVVTRTSCSNCSVEGSSAWRSMAARCESYQARSCGSERTSYADCSSAKSLVVSSTFPKLRSGWSSNALFRYAFLILVFYISNRTSDILTSSLFVRSLTLDPEKLVITCLGFSSAALVSAMATISIRRVTCTH